MPFFTASEVAQHNVEEDCWVSFFGKVYNLTKLAESNKGNILLKPILRFAGEDISHWFDEKTMEVKTCEDPKSGITVPYVPYGRFLHVPPNEPVTSWATDFVTPWWQDEKNCVGILSKKPRKIRVVNTLTSQDHELEVASEETLMEIQKRYFAINKHAGSYTWKRLKKPLNMQKTLEENHVFDESEEMNRLRIGEKTYTPTLHIYFNDDLSVA
mmetsp:Transcript_13959/g.16681  ORF Transcript_13959/g.16681 Transcript_13959/m.16681 type:complete len:213 (-) Transcript_13959:116-754(-)|eukprot:jgi/Bigna1/92803/estExt_fgenesh1_pm.C_720015